MLDLYAQAPDPKRLLLPASTHAQRPRELAFPGIAADGIFDPSIVGTRRGEWAWMAHSVVDPSARRPERNLLAVLLMIRVPLSDPRSIVN
jgi:hypothetical protein